MASGSIIGIGILLLISVILGFLGKKKWKTFDEYLVGKRDIGPIITGCALSASYLSGWAFCGSTGVVYTVGFLRDVVCRYLESSRPDSLHLARCPEDKRFFGQTRGRHRAGNHRQDGLSPRPSRRSSPSVCFIFLFMYSIGQLKAAGGVWYAVTGLPPFWCLLLSVIIAWLYMVLGGYVGTQWSMAFQGMLSGVCRRLAGYLGHYLCGRIF